KLNLKTHNIKKIHPPKPHHSQKQKRHPTPKNAKKQKPVKYEKPPNKKNQNAAGTQAPQNTHARNRTPLFYNNQKDEQKTADKNPQN
ncbi:hypothetical protein, partial [Salmonella enterica]|uniref:hypothetical protein n=1 Tax=Salmonella enterica TaxID=28901 RepID=UPI0020C5A974